MKKKGKKSMWIWIVIVLVVLVLTAGFIMMYPMLSMKPTETGEVEGTGVISVKGGLSSVYSLQTESGYILVDTGSNKDNLETSLRNLSIDPLKVEGILLTHSDSDHTAGINLFPNAKVYVSEDELQMLDGSIKRNSFSYSAWPEGFDSGRINTLTDGQQLSLGGFSITALKSSGHTAGSMSFLIDGAYLFSGDAFRLQNDEMLLHPFSMDKDAAKSSISRLHELMGKCRFVFTAHYGYRAAENLNIPM